ncbi:MAG: hypothetical protein EBS87_11965, partial [Sphingomonadaceae bacterium]|nr:hypothetical protein [Sphingomonadaceae bacterium]
TGGPYGGQNPPPNSGTQFDPPRAPGQPLPPRVAHIVRKNQQNRWMDDNNRDWTSFITWDFFDHDVAIVDASTLAVSYAGGALSTVSGIGVAPNGSVTAVGWDALNHVRFEPKLDGIFATMLMANVPAAGGAITVSGTAGTGVTRAPSGIQLDGGTTHIFSSSGSIAVTGVGASTDVGLALAGGAGFNIGWNGTGSATSGAVTLSADRATFANTTIRSSGAVTLQSVGAKFLSALSTTNLTFGTAAASLTLGKSTNDSAVTVGSTLTAAGPISVYGGDVTRAP